MATNYVHKGDVIRYSNAGAAIASGDLVVMGNTIGVALEDIAATTGVGSVAIEGVFTVPKVSAAVFAQGEALILDVSATPPAFDDSAATPAAGDITGGAIAMVAGANLETTCTVKLTPGNTTVTGE